jgi:hypothetical protein
MIQYSRKGETSLNRFWKWTLAILGILIALAIVAIPFAMHSVFGFSMARGFDGWNGPMMRDHHGLGFDRFHGPLMYGRGFGPWGAFSFFGGLVKLAFFGALLYGAYWLGKRNARVVLDPSTGPSAPAPTVEPEAGPEDA